jgi:membrane protease YdiL (CAAX protease family)
VTGAVPISAGPLAALLIRSRLRSFRNSLRARGSRRTPVLATVAGLIIALAYVGLFSQAFSAIVASVGLVEQAAALALVTGTLALGSLTAKAASSDAVRAGSAENEFLLARPVSLPALVAARGLADAVTDPMGALFLFPVLIAAALVWRLPPVAWLLCAAISSAVQVAISMLAYATQLLVVRVAAPAWRRTVWMGLRLVAALALAAVWMVGTWVLRTPAALAARLSTIAWWANLTPGSLIVAPLHAVVRGDTLAALGALGFLWLCAAAALLVAVAVAGRAGMSGWEEAGAPWAEAAPVPSERSRPISAATKDLRLITRDRGQVLVLIAMPAIFVGIQIFGSAGWTWSTASLARISCLAYSLALYMATIGPLTHMQAERRAFWILRTVPVPLAKLFAAKARAWSIVVGGAAAFAFLPLALVMPPAPLGSVVVAGLLVVGGATSMTFLAIAMAAGGADLSDEQTTAVGPVTIYAFLLVGGLYNLVLTGDPRTRLSGLGLYLFVTAAYWGAGVSRAEICLDAEAVRTPRLRTADAATLLLIFALGSRGLGTALASARGSLAATLQVMQLGWLVLSALVALALLRRAPPVPGRRGLVVSAAAGLVIGGVFGLVLAMVGAAGAFPPGARATLSGAPFSVLLTLALSLLAEEVIFRGVLQRALEQDLASPGMSIGRARGAAAVVTGALGIVALAMTTAPLTRLTIALQIAASLSRAVTGRVSAAWLARLAGATVCAFL